MSYREVIKELESIGLEIDYSVIDVPDLDAVCQDEEDFRSQLTHEQ